MKSLVNRITELENKSFKTEICDRILGQLTFACTLTEENTKFLPLVKKATDTYEEYLTKGTVNKSVLEGIENILMPLSEAAKEYKIICPAHAHIDMNWQWSYDETVMTTVDTFRTMLDILEEYPEYKFSQSQASVYRIIEEHQPGMLDKIKKYVHEGRWEVTASTWVEADKNMPIGESFARHYLYTKNYLADLLEIDINFMNIDFEPDTFGHSINVPEMAQKAGVKYYYHCRGNDGGNYLYRWQSPSGSEIIVYRDPFFYNSFIDRTLANSVVKLAKETGMKSLLKVYGVGDHGGGPTRRDVHNLIEMSKWPVFPQIKLGTFKEYFTEAEKIKEALPLETGEINFICDGCYTSQSRIKAGVIRGERSLKQAEIFTAFADNYDFKKNYKSAWEKVLFNQFHDIITGSGVIDTREYASGTSQWVQAETKTGIKTALYTIAGNIDTSMVEVFDIQSYSFGAGSGNAQTECASGLTRIYHIFSSSQDEFKGLCCLKIWDYEGDEKNIYFTDIKGERLESQISATGNYWGHHYIEYYVDVTIPTFGYTTVVCRQGEKEEFDYGFITEMRRQYEENYTLENDNLRAVINPDNGSIISIIDKKSGKELLDNSKGGAQLLLIDEANHKQITFWNNSMSSWFTGRDKNVLKLKNVEIYPGKTGELRNSFIVEGMLRDSKVKFEIILDKDSDTLDFSFNCDWREFGDSNEKIPSLAFFVPLKEKADEYLYDVPFGILSRKEMNLDRPANSFVSAGGIMLISEAKYGFKGYDNSICLRLLRSSTDPDPIPEICIHDMMFSLSLTQNQSKDELIKKAQLKYNTLHVLSGKKHNGSLAATASLLTVSGKSVVSCIKKAEHVNGLCVRLYNPTEYALEEKISLNNFINKTLKSAYISDICEREKLGEVTVNGKDIAYTSNKYEVTTIIIEFCEE